MPSFMTTQWTPQLDTTGRVTGFSSSARGYDAKPGATVEMSDRTYAVAADVRRADAAHTGLRKKERVKQRRQASGAQEKLSKRGRAAIQRAQEIERRQQSNVEPRDGEE